MNQFFKIPYHQNFLYCLYKQIIFDNSVQKLEDLIVILPDQNSVNQLKKIFQENIIDGAFLPAIIALSDYQKLSKYFAIEVNSNDQFHNNFKVRINLINFINSCDYIDEIDKLTILEDLSKLLNDLYQSGINITDVNFPSFEKSIEEKLLSKLLNDFKNYVKINEFTFQDYVINFEQIEILFKIAKLLQNQKHNFKNKIIIAGSSFSLYVTQNLANSIIANKFNQIFIVDYESITIDLDNQFIKSLKHQYDFKTLIDNQETKTNEAVKCYIFNDEYQEAQFVNYQLKNDKTKAIINGHELRFLVNNLINPLYYEDNLNLQKNLIINFLFNDVSDINILKCESFKNIEAQTLFYNQEKQKNFVNFYQNFSKTKGINDLEIEEKFCLFKKLVEEYQLSLSKNLLSKFEIIIKFISSIKNIKLLTKLDFLKFLISDLKPVLSNSKYLKFSYESKLFKSDNIVIAGLNDKNWINQNQYNVIKSEILQSLGLRSEIDYHLLALQDFITLFSCKNICLSFTNDANSDPLAILTLLEQKAKVLFIKPITQFTPKYKKNVFAKVKEKSQITRISVSDFKTLIENPYGIYVKKILRLQNLDNIYKSSLRKIYGVIIHKVIETYTQKQEQISGDHLKFLISEFYSLSQMTQYHEMLKLLNTKITNLFQWWIKEHKKLSLNSVKTLTELKVEARFNDLVNITAIFDRIELEVNDDFKIIDYKTSKLPSDKDIKTGKYTQLILEALIYIKANKLTIQNIQDPVLVGLSGDINFVKNQILELNNFANNLLEFENMINDVFTVFFASETKLYAFPVPDSKQYSDYIHITRLEA